MSYFSLMMTLATVACVHTHDAFVAVLSDLNTWRIHFIEWYKKCQSERLKPFESLKYTYSGKRCDAMLKRGSEFAAGMDLHIENLVARDGDTAIYDTNLAVSIPCGYVGLIVERSSTHKRGYTLANTVGVIDSDYRGTIKICLRQIREDAVPIELPARVAQLIIVPHVNLVPVRVFTLDPTERGSGGFGSSDKFECSSTSRVEATNSPFSRFIH